MRFFSSIISSEAAHHLRPQPHRSSVKVTCSESVISSTLRARMTITGNASSAAIKPSQAATAVAEHHQDLPQPHQHRPNRHSYPHPHHHSHGRRRHRPCRHRPIITTFSTSTTSSTHKEPMPDGGFGPTHKNMKNTISGTDILYLPK